MISTIINDFEIKYKELLYNKVSKAFSLLTDKEVEFLLENKKDLMSILSKSKDKIPNIILDKAFEIIEDLIKSR